MDGGPIDPRPDEELVEAAQQARPGDGRAFHELVRRHEGHVRANCRYMVADDAASEDLAQEVFVKAYFALSRFEGRARFSTWVRRIKVNHCLNHLSARGRRPTVDIEAPGLQGHAELATAPAAPAALEREDLRDRVDRVLRGLNDTLRIPLVLRDMDGMSYDEVAETLGIGLSAVKMRIKRGREAFRQAWDAAEEEGAS